VSTSAALRVVPLRNLRPPRKTKRQPPDTWGPPLEPKSAISFKHDWLDEVAKRWDLGRTDLAVAIVLKSAFGYRKKYYAELSLEIIAERAGCSPRQAHRSVMNLRRNGLIKVRNEGCRIGPRQETNQYVLTYLSRGWI
jgi:hypothetical protein